MEQLGLKLMFLWDAGPESNSFTHYTRGSAPSIFFFIPTVKSWSIVWVHGPGVSMAFGTATSHISVPVCTVQFWLQLPGNTHPEKRQAMMAQALQGHCQPGFLGLVPAVGAGEWTDRFFPSISSKMKYILNWVRLLFWKPELQKHAIGLKFPRSVCKLCPTIVTL